LLREKQFEIRVRCRVGRWRVPLADGDAQFPPEPRLRDLSTRPRSVRCGRLPPARRLQAVQLIKGFPGARSSLRALSSMEVMQRGAVVGWIVRGFLGESTGLELLVVDTLSFRLRIGDASLEEAKHVFFAPLFALRPRNNACPLPALGSPLIQPLGIAKQSLLCRLGSDFGVTGSGCLSCGGSRPSLRTYRGPSQTAIG
jgi:hypothetical protein